MKQRILGLVVMLCCAFASVCAQPGILYDGDSRLSSSLVKYAYQDSRGIMWIVTNNGLDKYDGYDFTTINKEDGLNSDMINYVAEDGSGHIYVCQANGIQVIVNDQPVQVTKDGAQIDCWVSHMTMRRHGMPVFATSGIGLFEMTGLTTAKSIFPDEKSLDFVRKVMEDSEGNIWAVTEDKGVIRIDKKGKLKSYFDDADKRSSMTDICQDDNGNIYIGCTNYGVYAMRKGMTDFALMPATQGIPVSSLLPRKGGVLMIGCNGQGLKLLDTRTGTLTNSTLHTQNANLDNTKVTSITTDRNNNIWLSLFQKGLFVETDQGSRFEYIGHKGAGKSPIGDQCVMATYRSADGTIWIGTDGGGLYGIDASRGYEQTAHFAPGNNENSMPSTILCIAEDETGRLWVGSYTKGCGWIDKKTGEYHRMAWSYGKAASVFEIIADKKGRLWFGTLGSGLKLYDTTTGETKDYRQNQEQSDQGIANDYIMQMRLSRNGQQLYVGTSMGLSTLDIPTGSWTKTFGTNLLLKDVNTVGIMEDSKGRVWVCSPEGLFMIEKKPDPKITKYTTKEGLPSNATADIQEDKAGNLWISTKKGLCRMDGKTGKMTNYFVSDGLQGNEFSEGVSTALANGKLLFGGMAGITVFNPDNVKPVTQKLSVTLTGIEVGNTLVKAGMKSGSYVICDTTAAASTRFDLCHQDNTVTLRLSTLTFRDQERTTYRYRIGNDKWTTLAEGDNRLTLTQLTPGTYDMQIQAMLNGDASDIKDITIVVHNPWYFSWWAKTIYFIILICICLWLYHNMKQRQQDKLDLQKHKHAEEMNDAKLRFFIDLSHEIRTPMTLITSPLQQLMTEDENPHRNAIYATIKRNAERILHIVNQIMDIRKIDKGQMRMQMQETDMVKMVNEISSLFAYTAENKHINLQFVHNGIEELEAWVDRTAMDKVMMNLLSNAIKFTHNGGNITIELTHDEKQLQLCVSDDGIPIPEGQLEKIFERFYQPKENVKPGTGVGLDLTRSLVELQHGTIHAENLPDGKGCKFVVCLPLGKAHLNADEILETKEAVHHIVQKEVVSQVEDIENAPPSLKIGKKQTIVVAEDDDEIRQYLEQSLSETFRVIACQDGSEALPIIQRELPQLVITDIMMPKMNGHELCTKIKSNIRTNDIPVIMLSAKTMDNDVLEGLELGADEYVPKPFNMEILQRTIINLINTRRLMKKKFSGEESQSDKIENIEMSSPDEKLLAKIMDVINRNISNSEMSVDMIAREVGLSRVHLHRKMKELTNQTPHDFIKNLRMEQAAKLLASGNHNIAEVVYKCGFNNATSFSTMFKKMYGQTPSEYMKGYQ